MNQYQILRIALVVSVIMLLIAICTSCAVVSNPKSAAKAKPHVTKLTPTMNGIIVEARYSYKVYTVEFECLPDSITIGKAVNVKGWKRIR